MEELGIQRTGKTAMYYLRNLHRRPVNAGKTHKNVRTTKLAKPLPVFLVERVPVCYDCEDKIVGLP